MAFMLHYRLKIYFKYLPVYLSNIQNKNVFRPPIFDDYDETFTVFHVSLQHYVLSVMIFMVVPTLIAFISFKYKSIFLVDGAFTRIQNCTKDDGIKAL